MPGSRIHRNEILARTKSCKRTDATNSAPTESSLLRSINGPGCYTLIDLGTGASTDLASSYRCLGPRRHHNDGGWSSALPGACTFGRPIATGSSHGLLRQCRGVSADGRIIIYSRFESTATLYSHLYSLVTETGRSPLSPATAGAQTISGDGTFFSISVPCRSLWTAAFRGAAGLRPTCGRSPATGRSSVKR